MVMPVVTSLGIAYGILLGSTVVAAWGLYAAADSNVAGEASTLTTMYRQTIPMPTAERREMRALLRDYTGAVIGPEWKVQYTGGTSLAAGAALTAMYRSFGQLPGSVAGSTVNSQFFSELTVLASDRNNRTLDARTQVPLILWVGLLFGGFAVVTISGFFYLDAKLYHAMLSSLVAVLIGMLLFATFALDHPFGRQLGITPAQFGHSLAVFNAIDRGD